MLNPERFATEHVSDRNLALELVRVTESAALGASRWMGLGKKNEADEAAVTAMRRAFDTIAISGTVVIGEGEMDEAPMLYIGEKVGCGGPEMDIAVDPLEGTILCAKGGPNALAVIALAEHGNFLHAPDVYMDKIAVGGGLPPGLVDLDAPVEENLRNLARAKGCEISDLVVCILDRERHADKIAHSRAAGARIMLISDGDVAGIMATTRPDTVALTSTLVAGSTTPNSRTLTWRSSAWTRPSRNGGAWAAPLARSRLRPASSRPTATTVKESTTHMVLRKMPPIINNPCFSFFNFPVWYYLNLQYCCINYFLSRSCNNPTF